MGEVRRNFATRLRKYRHLLGLSQDRFSRKLGIAKTTLIDWEKPDGKWGPEWEQLEELCSWTGIKPVYFFVDDDFGSDFFELAERIKATDPDLRNIIGGLISYSERLRIDLARLPSGAGGDT